MDNAGLQTFMDILGYVGAVGVAIFSSPELIRTFRTKKTAHLNAYMFILLAVASFSFFVSGIYTSVVLANNNENFAFSLAVSIANFFSFAIPVVILTYKFGRIIKAKRQNLTELAYEQKILNQQAAAK